MLRWKLLVASAAIALSGVMPAHAETGVTKDTIKIGIFAPMTGKSAIFGKYIIGVQAYYKMINDQGGINGRKIVTYLEDDACDPATAVAATKKLVAQDGVFMLHAGVCTAGTMAVKDELLRQGVPFMNLGAAGSSITVPTVANMFSPLPNTIVVGRTLVNFAMSRPNTKRLTVISHPDDWGHSQVDPAIELLKKQYNLEFVENVTMERGATDITPQILKLRQSKPDVVLSFLYPTETAIFVREAHKYGLDKPLLACFGASYEDTVRRVDNAAASKNLYVFHALAGAANGEKMKKWADMIHKYGDPKEEIENFVLSGIGGAEVIVEAIKKAGPDLTRQKFIDALNSTKDFDTGVLSAPITFTPEDHGGVKSGAMITEVDGKLVSFATWPKEKN